jgi:hypothetical protein
MGANTTICLKAIIIKVDLYGLRKQPNLWGNPKSSLFRGRRRKVDGVKGSEPSTDSLNLLGEEAHHVHFRARLKRDPTKKEFF